jgi:hypothetical protein
VHGFQQKLHEGDQLWILMLEILFVDKQTQTRKSWVDVKFLPQTDRTYTPFFQKKQRN